MYAILVCSSDLFEVWCQLLVVEISFIPRPNLLVSTFSNVAFFGNPLRCRSSRTMPCFERSQSKEISIIVPSMFHRLL